MHTCRWSRTWQHQADHSDSWQSPELAAGDWWRSLQPHGHMPAMHSGQRSLERGAALCLQNPKKTTTKASTINSGLCEFVWGVWLHAELLHNCQPPQCGGKVCMFPVTLRAMNTLPWNKKPKPPPGGRPESRAYRGVFDNKTLICGPWLGAVQGNYLQNSLEGFQTYLVNPNRWWRWIGNPM